MTEIRLEGIAKRFGRTAALEGIDLELPSGALTALVGPSGCGKSTLLNLIAGLEAPSAGRVLFDGRPVEHLSPRERDVAVVFQSYALYPHLSAFENVAFPLRVARLPRAEVERRVRATAELLHIGELLARKPRELSGGQRQRVALARAMVRRPRVFLFDEPLSNLDAALRLSMRAEIKRLHRELGATFVYVTHDQTEALTLSERMAVLRAGRLHQVGAPLEVYRAPADTFVARFVGSPPMNLLPARVEGGLLRLEGANAPLARTDDGAGSVTLGVRPEDVVVGTDEPPALPARVALVEPLGAEAHVHLALAGGELVARVGGAAPREGERVGLRLPHGALHLFDAQTGARRVASLSAPGGHP